MFMGLIAWQTYDSGPDPRPCMCRKSRTLLHKAEAFAAMIDQ